MKINCGIIGLPNVGKSTLFNLLTNVAVKIDNFPFSTIQPNFATIHIPDNRLHLINQITQSKVIVPEVIQFIDIAGLIKGAFKGEGLGNKILNHIKTATILCHVVRCFENELITHVEKNIDPYRDTNIINTELILFDILQCEQNINALQKNRISNDYNNKTMLFCLKKCLNGLYNGLVLRNVKFSQTEIKNIQKYNFLTFKPVIYIANVNENYINNFHFEKLKKIGSRENSPVISYCADCSDKSKSSLNNNILNMLIKNIISLLQLQTFFTVNINMVRSWIYPSGTVALNAAYQVHSDFKKGFIRAQVIKYHDFIQNQGENRSKKLGKLYFVGKDYLVEDGDILKFLFQK